MPPLYTPGERIQHLALLPFPIVVVLPPLFGQRQSLLGQVNQPVVLMDGRDANGSGILAWNWRGAGFTVFVPGAQLPTIRMYAWPCEPFWRVIVADPPVTANEPPPAARQAESDCAEPSKTTVELPPIENAGQP